jgi:hypothetical protein
VAQAKLLLRLPARQPDGPDLAGGPDRVGEAGEALLEDVVVGSGLDAVGRGFLVERARHDDERQVRPERPDDLQRLHAIPGGKREVREDDVRCERLERLAELGLRLDPAPLALDPGSAELANLELGVRRNVLEDEGPEGIGGRWNGRRHRRLTRAAG